jgi:hypothetical protein
MEDLKLLEADSSSYSDLVAYLNFLSVEGEDFLCQISKFGLKVVGSCELGI